MKNILVVDDEKLIRTGLVAMIKRSGVAFEEIFQAKNGAEALEIIKNTKLDLVLTDIKMPVMDGITLVSKANELSVCPMFVVISGFDDFSFAVEMLRNGVYDYLLKPVERERLFEVLNNVEKQISHTASQKQSIEYSFKQALKSLCVLDIRSSEREMLIDSYKDHFFKGNFITVCTKEELECGQVEVISFETPERLVLSFLQDDEDTQQHLRGYEKLIGISGSFSCMDDLAQSCDQAMKAYKYAFFMRRYKQGNFRYPDVPAYAEPSVDEREVDKIVNLVGAEKWDEVKHRVSMKFDSAFLKKESPDSVIMFMNELVRQLIENYKSLMSEDFSKDILSPLEFPDADSYLNRFFEWIETFSHTLAHEFADYANKRRIREAVIYIQSNFQKPLNMAMVSNEVSMNYSLFSNLFKQYVGTNFVNYLHELRISEAKKLLAQTDFKVNEIGRKVGFTDEKNFLKVFKNQCGISPTEYRKNAMLSR